MDILMNLLLVGASGFFVFSIAAMFKDLDNKERENHREVFACKRTCDTGNCCDPRTKNAELEKEADEYAKKDRLNNFLCTIDIARRAYLAGAESREKEEEK